MIATLGAILESVVLLVVVFMGGSSGAGAGAGAAAGDLLPLEVVAGAAEEDALLVFKGVSSDRLSFWRFEGKHMESWNARDVGLLYSCGRAPIATSDTVGAHGSGVDDGMGRAGC